MSIATAEIVRLCEALSAEKRAEVVDFARFLLDRTEHPDDLAWEKRLSDPVKRPKLEAFARSAEAEGGSVPLDLKQL